MWVNLRCTIRGLITCIDLELGQLAQSTRKAAPEFWCNMIECRLYWILLNVYGVLRVTCNIYHCCQSWSCNPHSLLLVRVALTFELSIRHAFNWVYKTWVISLALKHLRAHMDVQLYMLSLTPKDHDQVFVSISCVVW